jgi:hypothetical protein
MDERQLRAMIHERMQSGLLPGAPDGKTYGGKGTNSTCACCSNTIGRREVEYEVHFDGYPSVFRVHLGCYRIWWEERECADAAESMAPPAGSPRSSWRTRPTKPEQNIG